MESFVVKTEKPETRSHKRLCLLLKQQIWQTAFCRENSGNNKEVWENSRQL